MVGCDVGTDIVEGIVGVKEGREVGSDDDGVKLLGYLRRLYPRLPRGLLEKGMRKGWVRVDGGRVRGCRILRKGERVRLPPFFEEGGGRDGYKPSAEDIDFLRGMEIGRSADYVYFDKPEGLAVQGGSGVACHMDGMLRGYLEGEEARLIHRLDKRTSGVLAVARTRRSAAEAGRLFSGRGVKKLYWSLVLGDVEGEKGEVGDDVSRTRYSVEWSDGSGLKVLALRPVTGRKHQLRVHVEKMGGMIVGEDRYGGGEMREKMMGLGLRNERLMLHNGLLGLEGEDDVTSGLPDDFLSVLHKVGCEGLDLRDYRSVWKDVSG